ncbi:D-alanine--D-alanine ligase [Neobacillus mesonae]|nr:D-alanine--D-alanine ligase [Neobacillus mesonae]
MKVGVIMGGVSSEREVSLLTGRQMIAHLDPMKYDPIPIDINDKYDLITKTKNIDVALLALHGKYGEDGTVQATLESMGIPYTGSGVLSSSICMDKDISKKLLRQEGLLTPDWIVVSSLEELSTANMDTISYPVVVKPNSGGSSIGTRIVRSRESLKEAVAEALKWDSIVMIEQCVIGEEITCSVLDGKLLPVISIKPNAAFFDYSSKYETGGADEKVIELPHELREQVNKTVLQCCKALRCSVYARVDIIVVNGMPYVLEVNTLPGLTQTSLLPQSAESVGISFGALLDSIIELSLKERKQEYNGYKE